MAGEFASPVLSLPATESAHSSPNPKTLMSLPKKAQSWTPLETFNLIHAYQEKWYSLKRGQLKACQWEEVAVNVVSLSGFYHPSKSATQCRHKIEKLRKRYRAERLKPNPGSWQFFELMDGMERGILPIAARPVAMVKYEDSNSRYDEDSDREAMNFSYECADFNKNKTIKHIVRGELGVNRIHNICRNVNTVEMGWNLGAQNDGRSSMNGEIEGYFTTEPSDDEEEDEELDGDDEEEEEEGGDGGSDLAMEIRDFSPEFLQNGEQEEIMETERCRVEMEKKRMNMILQAQRKIIDTVNSAFRQNKRVKMAHEF